MLVISLGAAGLLLSGCEESCKGQPLENEEGHTYPCVGAVDCPRLGDEILCTNTRERLGNCVDCIHNACTLFNKDACG